MRPLRCGNESRQRRHPRCVALSASDRFAVWVPVHPVVGWVACGVGTRRGEAVGGQSGCTGPAWPPPGSTPSSDPGTSEAGIRQAAAQASKLALTALRYEPLDAHQRHAYRIHDTTSGAVMQGSTCSPLPEHPSSPHGRSASSPPRITLSPRERQCHSAAVKSLARPCSWVSPSPRPKRALADGGGRPDPTAGRGPVAAPAPRGEEGLVSRARRP